MKIFYAVQATGNGHISRAVQLLPYLQRYGKVDIFLSGSNAQLKHQLPVRYRSGGLSLFYNNNGGLKHIQTAARINPIRLMKEIRELPLENYDIIINDFECITALACSYKKLSSVNFGHQAAFHSGNVPRPAKINRVGEWILQNYARASGYVGLHFKKYDEFIYEPVIKKEILQARPTNKGHITVYLSAYDDKMLLAVFHRLPAFRFELFSRKVQTAERSKNVTLLPISQQRFNDSMLHSYGVITGAGFETPAEAMHLGKKLLVIPIQGQYEQQCNGAALEQMGVMVLTKIDDSFIQRFWSWITSKPAESVSYKNNIPEMLEFLIDHYPPQRVALELLFPEMLLT